MLDKIISFGSSLFSGWGLMSSIAIAALLALGVEEYRIAHLKEDIELKTAQIITLTADKKAIELQQESLKNEMSLKQEIAFKNIEQIEHLKQQKQKVITKIIKERREANETDCASAMSLFRGFQF